MFELLFKYGVEDYARGELVFTGTWPLWLLFGLACIAAAGIGLVLYRRSGGSPAARLTVGLLQFTVVAIVLLLLAQPALRTESLKPGQNALALMLDNSASMAYGDAEPRLDSARRQLAEAAALTAPLDMEIRHYTLGATADAADGFEDTRATGRATDFATALLAVLDEAASTSLAAIVVASDGIDTTGGLATPELAGIAAYGVPVFTLAAGRESLAEDLELAGVSVPQRALPGSTLTANVSIRHDAPGSTRVKVYDGDELLVSAPVELPAGARTTSVAVDIEELSPGYRELSFSVDPLPDEREIRNNRRTALVAVEERRRRLLYFEGEPRWEYKFMRRAVAADEQVDLVTLLRVSPNKFYRQGLESPEELAAGFPTSREELFAYDALIIGSVEAAAFTPAQLTIIGDFVSERGGSLLLLAGPNGLGNGGWGQSAIADVLPVRLPPATEDSFFRRKVDARLTPQGADVEMLRLAPGDDANRASWEELPAIADYQATGGLKPAATALLRAATADGEIPLLVTQPFGRGQAWIMATGGTWRWQMSLPVGDQRHETFWRQFLRALVAAVPDPVRLSATAGGERMELRAEFRDAAFEAVRDLEVRARVAHAATEPLEVELAPSPGEPGIYRASLDGVRAGTWYVEVAAEREGETFATARTGLMADPAQAEYFSLRADHRFLERLAETTGGRHIAADEIPALPRLIAYSGSGISEAVYRPVWDAPIVLILLLALKIGEWLLRRRWRSI